MSEVATNDRAVIGGNHPPEPTTDATPIKPKLTALQALLTKIETYRKITPKVTTAEEATKVKELLDELRPALKEAEEERKANNQPHDAAIAANNKTYFEWTEAPAAKELAKGKKQGKAVVAGVALKTLADDYLAAKAAEAEAARREAAERQRIADEEARKAREEAERLANEGRLREAAAAAAVAEKAEVSSAQAGFERRQEPSKAAITGGSGRAMTTRTTWHAEVTDLDKAAAHYGGYPEFKEAIAAATRQIVTKLAEADAIAFKDAEMAPSGVRFFSKTGL